MSPRYPVYKLTCPLKIPLYSWKMIDQRYIKSKFRLPKIKLSSFRGSETAKMWLGKRFIIIYAIISVFRRKESKL